MTTLVTFNPNTDANLAFKQAMFSQEAEDLGQTLELCSHLLIAADDLERNVLTAPADPEFSNWQALWFILKQVSQSMMTPHEPVITPPSHVMETVMDLADRRYRYHLQSLDMVMMTTLPWDHVRLTLKAVRDQDSDKLGGVMFS